MNYTKLTISEPWDFKSNSGSNVLDGKVLRQIDDKNLIFEASESIEIEEAKGRLWILALRYQGDSFDKPDERKTVGGAILLTDNYTSGSAEEIKKMSKYAVIGSLST